MMSVLFDNKKARFDYELIEEYEAGIALLGWEVKSVRARTGNLKASWCKIKNGEIWLEGFKLAAFKFSSDPQDLVRAKKLLLNKKEILRLENKLREGNFTIVPLKVFLTRGKIKCKIALAKGRKKYQKKQVLKDRTLKREAEKAMKQF